MSYLTNFSKVMNRKIKDGGKRFLGKYSNTIRDIYGLNEIDLLFDRVAAIQDVYLPASVHHQKVFPKYKDIYREKTVVITGTGPTFEKYEPINDAIHIAINRSILNKTIDYSYFFCSDYGEEIKEALEYLYVYKKEVVKFFPYKQNYHISGAVPAKYIDDKNVETYYCDEIGWNHKSYKKISKYTFPIDISCMPLKTYCTTMHLALQFALWTHPKKICLVGADCSNGYASNLGYKGNTSLEYLIRPWKEIAEFVSAFYSDIEMVSINPVGLKGIFRDEYTTSR